MVVYQLSSTSFTFNCKKKKNNNYKKIDNSSIHKKEEEEQEEIKLYWWKSRLYEISFHLGIFMFFSKRSIKLWHN